MEFQISGKYDIQKSLIEILLSKGYPEESLHTNWRQGMYDFDLVIIDPKSEKFFAFFLYQVYKANPVVISSESIRKVFLAFASLIAEVKTHLYIIGLK